MADFRKEIMAQPIPGLNNISLVIHLLVIVVAKTSTTIKKLLGKFIKRK